LQVADPVNQQLGDLLAVKSEIGLEQLLIEGQVFGTDLFGKGLGMGRGPALALLLAGPALSLPSIAVIYSVIGFKKTFVFCSLTVVLSAVVGMVFGVLYG